MSLILGIDTGGTYTDGVIFYKEKNSIIAKAKTLTTRNDFCICIGNCLDLLPADKLEEVEMVCLSTTMATNAVVESKGCKVALLVMGKMPHGELPAAETYMIKGMLDIQGRIMHDVDTAEIDQVLARMSTDIEAVVISGYASVRNPIHEIKVKEYIESKTDLPVVCAHELTGTLGFYERTVTSVLNGQLVPIIRNLIWDARVKLRDKGIDAPVMIVKGDGTFMSTDTARHRPIDTLLSGPAASVVGAMFLSNENNAVIADMGGTTTDIACLDNGKVRITNEGASVAGWRTRVRAIDIYTKGLGGDSIISIDDDGEVHIGPEKVVPICLSDMQANQYGDIAIGFTPTDLAHIKGICDEWSADASRNWLKDKAKEMGVAEDELYERIENAFLDKVYDALTESEQYVDGDIIVGIGAPAMPWMPYVARRHGLDIRVPQNSEVANAIGAAVGNIEESCEITIRRDVVSGLFIGYLPWERIEFNSLDEAIDECTNEGKEWLLNKTKLSGCATPEIIVEKEDVYCNLYNSESKDYVETQISLIAVGNPTFV